ncbi:MAG: hypothetical protein K0Q78_2567 [Cellvibrio sp.]|nr:hypothetical protein [Cellvibrio sp.]
MKSFSIRPSKFLSIMMILGGALVLYALSEFPKPPDGFADSVLTFMQISVIVVMIFGLANLVLPKGIATELIEITSSTKYKSPASESFAALQHLYEKGLLTHEEYRRKVDLLTRADTNSQAKK